MSACSASLVGLRGIFGVLLFGSSWLGAATYYVSPSGNDANSGLSLSAAIATPQVALNKALPGDTVFLRGGTYTYASGSNPLTFTTAHRGSDAQWLFVKAYPGETPVLKITRAGAVWTAIDLNVAAYVEVSGLTLEGWNDEVALDEAKADYAAASASAVFNGNGFASDGRSATDTNRPHHLRILGNTVRKFPGAGISSIQGDYITVEGNTVTDTSWFTRYATSGISLWQAWNYPDALTADTSDYRMRVVGNRCFGNKTLVDWSVTGAPSDGNGIIIDDSRNTQNDSLRGAYNGRILVANNLVVNNGGSGIHSFLSDNVDIVHNTAYYNGQVLDYGEIYASESGNVRIYNNICHARPTRAINKENTANTNVDYRANLYFGGYAGAAFHTANNTTADPLFLNAAIDLATADFGVGSTSPALDAALTTYNSATLPWVAGLTTDLNGAARTRNGAPDLGAYERGGRAIPTTGLVVTGLSEAILAGDTTTGASNDTAFPATEINQPSAYAPVHTFTLTNRDSAAVTVSGLGLSGSAAFTVINTPALPLVLTPAASATFQVRFLPAAAGAQSATITVLHSSANTASPFTFVVTGTGVQIPLADLSATSLSATLPAATSTTHNGFVLTNPGTASLTWNAALPRVYTVADSLSPTGPVYGWVDIASTGTAVSFGNTDNAFSSALSLGFTFPYFGTGRTQLCIDINGHLSFDTSKAGNTQSRYRTPSSLSTMIVSNTGLLPTSIAAFFDDLLLISGTSSVRYQQTDANTFVVSWLNVTYKADANVAANLRRMLNFQVVLRRDGTITTQYQGVAKTDGNYLIGIVNTLPASGANDPKHYVQYAYTANAVNSGLAVRFTPPPRSYDVTTNFAPGGSTNSWAAFTGATSGTLAPGASQAIPIAFGSAGLVSGLVYATTLTLTTNDPANSSLYIPVSLTVGGTANFSPAVNLTAPDRNITVQGIGTPVVLAASASDTDGSVAGVSFYDGATLLATDTTAPYAYTWTPTAAGVHTITAKVTDNLGVTVSSQGVAVTVVNLPPVVTLTAPTATSTATVGVPVTLTASAADADAGAITKVEFYVNGLLTGTAPAAPYAASWTPPVLGPATVYAKAYDANGASAVSSTVTFAVVRPDLPATGLLAAWRLDETTGLLAADLSGNNRPATLANATNTTWSSSGKFRGALAFDGQNAAKAAFDHPAISAFSISAWVNGNAPTQAFPRILGLPGPGGTGGYNVFLRRNTTNGVTDADFTGGVGFSDGTGGDWYTGGTGNTLANGTWYHVVVTFDGAVNSAGPAIYVNGVARTVFNNGTTGRTATPTVIASTATIKGNLGNRVDAPRPWSGLLDQVRLYDRVLTSAEVAALYLDDGGPSAPSGLTATPVAGGIQLAWTPVAATNSTVTYQVARGLSAGGPFTALASGIAATSFTDTTTSPGTTYYYAVNATAAADNGPVATASATTWTALQSWRYATFGTIAATGNAADNADPDGDGVTNLLEYALDGSPFSAQDAPGATVQISNARLQLTFFRARADVTYIVQGSSDLATWTDLATNPGVVGQSVTVTDAGVIAPRRFLRLRVTAP